MSANSTALISRRSMATAAAPLSRTFNRIDSSFFVGGEQRRTRRSESTLAARRRPTRACYDTGAAVRQRPSATRTQTLWLFRELRRRQVFKVSAAYAVGAWVVVQLTAIIQPAFALSPRWVPIVFVLALVGLPVAIALSWIYDLTPQGFRATLRASVEGIADDSEPDGAALSRAGSALAAVAVLPFQKLTPTTPSAYLADALPIELQSLLSRMHELRVVSRQSAVARADAGSDLRAIARDLNVQYVISGSIAEIADALQINVQLDDAIEDRLLWSERYDVAAKDIERLQHEITEKVVGIFGGERLRMEIRRANDASATDNNAWQLVQRARAYLLDYTPASIATAIPLLRKAIEIDPKYAVGYATLGLVTAERTLNGISPNAADDRSFAINVVGRAERLAPRDAVVLRAAGCVYAYTGAYRRSLELLRRAVKLAPYDLGTWGYLGWPLVATGDPQDLQEVHDIVERLLKTSPQHPGRVYWLFHKSVAYTCADDCERALAQAEEYTAEQPRFSLGWLHYANVLARLGRHDAARAALDQSLERNPLLTPAYYAELMAVLTDQPAVVERRVAGLRAAGFVS
jgi:adenylate cyclase